MREQARHIVASWLREGLRRIDPSTGKPWKINALARRAVVSRQTLYNLLREQADAQDETLGRLAETLGVLPPRLDGEGSEAPATQAEVAAAYRRGYESGVADASAVMANLVEYVRAGAMAPTEDAEADEAARRTFDRLLHGRSAG